MYELSLKAIDIAPGLIKYGSYSNDDYISHVWILDQDGHINKVSDPNQYRVPDAAREQCYQQIRSSCIQPSLS